MRWEDGRRSDNVEDQRGARPSPKFALRGGLGLAIVALVAWLSQHDSHEIHQPLLLRRKAPANSAIVAATRATAGAGV
jgi:predicted metalloprotease